MSVGDEFYVRHLFLERFKFSGGRKHVIRRLGATNGEDADFVFQIRNCKRTYVLKMVTAEPCVLSLYIYSN